MTYTHFRQQQESFNTTDGTIKYIDKGEGNVILLLHGVPTSGWLYRHMIDSLAQHHRIIVPDMLGFGSSDSPNGYDIYSEQMHADRLLELMNHLHVSSWTHVLHDAGGLWTWELLKKDPKRISKLVVLNTLIYEEGFHPPIRFKKGLLAKIAMWSYRNGITTNAMLKGLFKSGLVENNLSKTDIEGYKTPLKEGKTHGMYYFFTQTCNALPDYSETLKDLQIPVMIIWGKHDTFLRIIPQKETVISDLNISEENIHLLKAKHFIQEEKPTKISELILTFLE
ncbi:MAG: alpha/beta hydrolase [Bacteroidetes bacterium]|nr:alpha/beta hydrolase [Bacteroidota bacterium]